MPRDEFAADQRFAHEYLNGLILQLQAARQQRALSQRGLGARLGMAEIVVGKWENNADLPSAGSFVRWAHALGHSVDILDRKRRPITQRPAPRHLEPFEDYEIRRIAAALKHARTEAELTQENLGELLDVSEWTVRMWETARRQPRILHLIRWADALGCRVVLGKG